MSREAFRVAVGNGHLAGWVDGAGLPVLLLHGGPGLSASILNGLIDELLPDYRVALYQQRGLAPSTQEGPFTIARSVADAVAVLDQLHWDKAFIVGHSWGGHLALHLAAGAPDRPRGVLSIDPIGGVGDGGMGMFNANMLARTPVANRTRLEELDETAMHREATNEEQDESFALFWPAYFANPDAAPPIPPVRHAPAAFAGCVESMVKELPALESALAGIRVPVGFVVGGMSPIPMDLAARPTAERIPDAWVDVIPDVGHFIWMETPGAVRSSLDRLTLQTATID